MNLKNRVGALERQIGAGDGCALCASREARAAAEVPREFGPEWERGEASPSTFNCPQCGRPFEIVFQVIRRRAEAWGACRNRELDCKP